jgi:hypothetical protein
MRSAANEAEAQEWLQREGLTDGLPVIVPTAERVDVMVLAGGLDGDLVLGTVGPSLDRATVEVVAVNAVMAGCQPHYFPLVVAAVEAVCAPEFDLAAVQNTTHGVTPMIIVNGLAREECGPVASGWGALGPGHRANATVGRALRLVLMNVGSARPGAGDMALLGNGAKFSYCLAEAEEASPFEPLHVARGLSADQSAVTVAGVEAPHSVICLAEAGDVTAPSRLVRALAESIASLASNAIYSPGASTVVVLNPDHAAVFQQAGWDRKRVTNELVDASRRPAAEVLAVNRAPKVADLEGSTLAAIEDAAHILLAVAGGPGIYSHVMPPWGGGQSGNMPVTRRVRIHEFC